MESTPNDTYPCQICATPVDGTSEYCTRCGARISKLDAASARAGQADVLPPGTWLHQQDYSVDGLLGRGAFGITYLGTDLRLSRRVAIKEFFPSGAVRRSQVVIPPVTMPHSQYELELERFLQEARILARF